MSSYRFLNRMSQPLIKVCGITCIEDALAAVEGGANALGFNFYPPSPRFLDFRKAEGIISGLPAGVMTFAVVVLGAPPVSGAGRDAGPDASGTLCGLDTYVVPGLTDVIQVHGINGVTQLPGSGCPMLIAVSPDTAPQFEDYDIIIDTSWGEGKLADWEKTSRLDRPYILSGGLNPGNIGEALSTLNPAGIDVCSGVESVPGRKDHVKMKDFLRKALTFYGRKRS
jgi:phosphoribosylanthranilate isomerase